MLCPGVALMQQSGQIVTQLSLVSHRGLEQRFLDVSRHIAPNGHRRLAEQQRKSLFVRHANPPPLLRLNGAKVPGGRTASIKEPRLSR
jgi:hypothetical protein